MKTRVGLIFGAMLMVVAGCIGSPEESLSPTGQSVAAIEQHGGVVATDGSSNGQYWERSVDLPYGPPPGSGGSPSNIDDFGMCAITGIAGWFDSLAMVRIDVNASYYYRITVRQGVSGRPQGATGVAAGWSCLRLKDFANAPSSSTAGTTGYTISTSSALTTHDQHSPAYEHACQWHGFSGAISANDGSSSGIDYVDAFARDWTGSTTIVEATGSAVATVQSRANCTYYTSAVTWTTAHASSAWNSYSTTTGGYNWTGIIPSVYWCYLEGVARHPNSSTGGTGNLQASVNQAMHGPSLEYYTFATGGAYALWNCLKLSH